MKLEGGYFCEHRENWRRKRCEEHMIIFYCIHVGNPTREIVIYFVYKQK